MTSREFKPGQQAIKIVAVLVFVTTLTGCKYQPAPSAEKKLSDGCAIASLLGACLRIDFLRTILGAKASR